MQLIIEKPGLLSTIQDSGRMYHLSQAVPVSGAMDALSMRVANKAVGNPDNTAVIEFTYGGAELLAETNLLIALAGEGASLYTDALELPSNKPLFIPAGTALRLAGKRTGSRSYLAVAGGWDVPEILQSKSTYLMAGFGGFKGRRLMSKDVLKSSTDVSAVTTRILAGLEGPRVNYPAWSIASDLLLPRNKKTIRVIPGREFGWFREESQHDFFSKPYCLSSNSNRMGYYLEGPLIARSVQDELLSTAVAAGTIQVTGNGTPILLMADAQTTGGYPRIAQVAAADLPLCAQLKPGDKIQFQEISISEAETLYFEQERQLRELTGAIHFKYF